MEAGARDGCHTESAVRKQSMRNASPQLAFSFRLVPDPMLSNDAAFV